LRWCTDVCFARLFGASAQLNLPEWKAVLRLADMWALDGQRATTVAQLDAQLPATRAAARLQLAYTYKIQAWIIPAVQQLVTRRLPLTAAGIGLLRPEVLANVLAIRDANLFVATYLIQDADGRSRYPLSDAAEKRIELEFGVVRL
jgi:hypothetical protein